MVEYEKLKKTGCVLCLQTGITEPNNILNFRDSIKFTLSWHFFGTRTETPLHLTDGQVNFIEPTDGHVCSIRGLRWEKLGGKLFGIAFMAIGDPPMEQPWPPVGIRNFRKKFELVT